MSSYYNGPRRPKKVLSVREELAKQIHAATHPRPERGLLVVPAESMRAIKKLVKAGGHAGAHEMLQDSLQARHAQPRYRALLIADELFRRSRAFRDLSAASFKVMVEATVGTRPDRPLPPPTAVAALLREKALEMIESWNEAFGAHYQEIRVAHRYLRDVLKMKFPDVVSARARREAAEARRQERSQQLLRTRLAQTRREMGEHAGDLRRLVREMRACFDLLMASLGAAQGDRGGCPFGGSSNGSSSSSSSSSGSGNGAAGGLSGDRSGSAERSELSTVDVESDSSSEYDDLVDVDDRINEDVDDEDGAEQDKEDDVGGGSGKGGDGGGDDGDDCGNGGDEGSDDDNVVDGLTTAAGRSGKDSVGMGIAMPRTVLSRVGSDRNTANTADATNTAVCDTLVQLDESEQKRDSLSGAGKGTPIEAEHTRTDGSSAAGATTATTATTTAATTATTLDEDEEEDFEWEDGGTDETTGSAAAPSSRNIPVGGNGSGGQDGSSRPTRTLNDVVQSAGLGSTAYAITVSINPAQRLKRIGAARETSDVTRAAREGCMELERQHLPRVAEWLSVLSRVTVPAAEQPRLEQDMTAVVELRRMAVDVIRQSKALGAAPIPQGKGRKRKKHPPNG